MHQFAFHTLALNDDRTIIAAAQRVLAQVQTQTRLLLLCAVAGKTFGGEDRLNMFIVIHSFTKHAGQQQAKQTE